MASLLVVTGPPGAGKSALARMLVGRATPSALVEGDVFGAFPWQLDDFMATGRIDSLDDAVLLPSVDVCVERVATRLGHGFDDESAARHMHDQFANATIDARHVLDDAEAAAHVMSDRIEALRASGTLRYLR